MNATYAFRIFLWCGFLIPALNLGGVLAGLPIPISRAYTPAILGNLLGGAIAIFLMSWAVTGLWNRFRSASDAPHYSRRWAFVAFLFAFLTYVGSIDKNAASSAQAENIAIGLNVLSAAGIIAIGLICLAWWGRKNMAFRTWLLSSLFWAIGTFLFVWIVDPFYNGDWSSMDHDEYVQMYKVMIAPPLFLGAVWFGYKRLLRPHFGRTINENVVSTKSATDERNNANLPG
jgi:hypothetical protein